MREESPTNNQVDQFILEQIDTVPQLEALLLLWNKRPRAWRLEELAAALYISPEETTAIVEPIERRLLIDRDDAGQYSYREGAHDPLVAAVDQTYRRELIRISRMIHSKAPSGVREFARAFNFRKDRG
jgi:hypothetical protein